TPAEAAAALAPFTAPGQRRILVVDDDAAVREAVALALEDAGYTVDRAAHGREALDRLRSGPCPALVLLGLAMPGVGGGPFLRAREAAPGLAAIRVVVVSASDPRQARAAALGAADYLHKPLDTSELTDKVRRHAPGGNGSVPPAPGT